MHIQPDGFHRVRHYGFFAKGERDFNLARVRDLLGRQTDQKADSLAAQAGDDEPHSPPHDPFAACPDCGGLMRRIGRVLAGHVFRYDTS